MPKLQLRCSGKATVLSKTLISRVGLIAGLFFVLMLGFQNCGDVGIAVPQEVEQGSTLQGMTAKFCVQKADENEEWLLEDAFVLNLNVRARGLGVYADSDADGIIDDDEVQSQTYDPQSRRTFGVLDSLCELANRVGCDLPFEDSDSFFFAGQDLSFSALSFNSLYSFDHDGDFIPNFAEILKGTQPQDRLFSDKTYDTDTNFRPNIVDLMAGMDPLSTLDNNLNDRILISRRPTQDHIDCKPDQTHFLRIDRLSVLPGLAFEANHPSDAPFNKSARQNHIFIGYTLSKSGSSERKLMYHMVKIDLDSPQKFELSPDDFIELE